jgi:organic hydroperoxide reductase OsmC/OhrA
MTKNEQGVPWVSAVTLNPVIVYAGGKTPDAAENARLHHLAHEQCFIANSIKTVVTVKTAPTASGSFHVLRENDPGASAH